MPYNPVNPNFNYSPSGATNSDFEPIDIQPIVDTLNDVKRAVIASNKQETVSVDNLDEIKKHLRVELKTVIDAIKAIKDFIPDAPKSIEVSNFPKSEKAPDNVKVNNLSELGEKLEQLLSAVQSLNVSPVVNVPAPIVNIPPQETPVVNIPQSLPPIVDVDINAIIAALRPLQLLSRDPNFPITVRMSDGRNFIDALTATLKENGERLATVVSTSYGLTKEEYKAAQRDLETFYKKGMDIPYHNEQVIDEADPSNVIITYKLDGNVVATKTISVSGTTTTITVS